MLKQAVGGFQNRTYTFLNYGAYREVSYPEGMDFYIKEGNEVRPQEKFCACPGEGKMAGDEGVTD